MAKRAAIVLPANIKSIKALGKDYGEQTLEVTLDVSVPRPETVEPFQQWLGYHRYDLQRAVAKQLQAEQPKGTKKKLEDLAQEVTDEQIEETGRPEYEKALEQARAHNRGLLNSAMMQGLLLSLLRQNVEITIRPAQAAFGELLGLVQPAIHAAAASASVEATSPVEEDPDGPEDDDDDGEEDD